MAKRPRSGAITKAIPERIRWLAKAHDLLEGNRVIGSENLHEGIQSELLAATATLKGINSTAERHWTNAGREYASLRTPDGHMHAVRIAAHHSLNLQGVAQTALVSTLGLWKGEERPMTPSSEGNLAPPKLGP